MIVMEPSPPLGGMLRTLGSGLLRANSVHAPSFATQWTCHDIWEFTWLDKKHNVKIWHNVLKHLWSTNGYFRTMQWLEWLEMCSKYVLRPRWELLSESTAEGTHYSLKLCRINIIKGPNIKYFWRILFFLCKSRVDCESGEYVFLLLSHKSTK